MPIRRGATHFAVSLWRIERSTTNIDRSTLDSIIPGLVARAGAAGGEEETDECSDSDPDGDSLIEISQ